MDEDDDSLDKLAADIADGGSIDWEAIARLPPDDPRRHFLEHLRVVAEIADHHRSAVDEPSEQVTTEPDPNQPARVGHVRAPAAAVEGQSVGRWGHLILRRRIGAGAFGEVFHAHDVWLDHPVALKLLKPEIAKRDSSRILHEARRLARVRHPNVVNVHGADMHDGRIGFWMDLIEGETLSELLSRGRLSHGEASHIGREICLALAAVHGASLIHRDVKAQNVMRAYNGGRIILMDFGAGEFMDRPSAAGKLSGTPLYLAPELFEHGSASVASDVYAAGVLLFHLVTQEFPVNGATIDALADAHRRGDRRRLRDARPDLPDSFVSVVERALDPNPERRFTSSGEMYEALGGTAAAARVDGAAQTSTTKQKVARVATAVALIVVVTEVVGLVASRIFEAILRVDPAFTAGLGEYFTVGRRALLPFVIVWTAAAAGFAVLLGLRPLIWSFLGPVRRRLSALNDRLDPTTAAGLIVCIGVVGFIWMAWQFYEVYWTMAGLMLNSRPEALDLSLLGWDGRPLHRLHSQVSVAVSFLMGLAALRWFPRLERRAVDPSRVRALRWAAAVVALLVVVMEAVTRPILWDRREVVLFNNQRATVIGTNSKELLLFTPERGERRYFRVPIDAPNIQRNVDSRPLFLGPEQ
jgi:protein kinase-like protein